MFYKSFNPLLEIPSQSPREYLRFSTGAFNPLLEIQERPVDVA